MTIVELPDKMTEYGTWVNSRVDGRNASSIWGFPEVKLSGAGDRWVVEVWERDSIIAFVYADAIRRR